VRKDGLEQVMPDFLRGIRDFRENNSLFRSIIDNLPLDFWAMDTEGRYIIQNAINRERWGDLVGKGIDALSLTPEMRALWEEQDAKALSGEIVEEEYAFQRGGEEIIARKRIGPLRVGDEVVGIVCANFDVTEQRRAEKTLHLTQFTVDRATYPIFWLNSDGQFLYLNDAAVRFWGYTRDEMLSMNVRDLRAEFPDEPWQDRWEELKKRGAIIVERMQRTKSGKTLQVEFLANYFEYQGEEYCCVFARDVTERRLADRIMRIQHDLGLGLSVSTNIEVTLALCIQAAMDIMGMDCGSVYIVDKNSGTLRLAYAQGFRRKVAEQLDPQPGDAAWGRIESGEHVAEDSPAYGDHTIREILGRQSAMDEGLRYSTAVPAYHDGQVVAWLTVGSHSCDETPLKTYREVLDTIADRMGSAIIHRSAEAEKARVAAELAQLIDTANAPIFGVDTNGNVNEWNRKMADLTGYSRAEAWGRDLVENFVEEEYRPNVRKSFRRAMKGKEVADLDMLLSTKNGDRIQILLNMAARRDMAGSIVGIVCVGQDVTESRNLQKELLDASARERRQIGQDLHDGLGQQLTGVLYLSQNLVSDLTDRGDSKATNAEAIANLVKQCIAQTRRLARGLMPVELDERGLVSALDTLAATTGKLFDVTCQVECKEKVLMKDNAVAEHLYHIAQEAVNNALKHGKARKIEISLTTTRAKVATTGKCGRGTLTICDDGTGFIFDKDTLDGLGLRIMEQRARMMDGIFHVKTAPGKGTVLTCTFFFQEDTGKEEG